MLALIAGVLTVVAANVGDISVVRGTVVSSAAITIVVCLAVVMIDVAVSAMTVATVIAAATSAAITIVVSLAVVMIDVAVSAMTVATATSVARIVGVGVTSVVTTAVVVSVMIVVMVAVLAATTAARTRTTRATPRLRNTCPLTAMSRPFLPA